MEFWGMLERRCQQGLMANLVPAAVLYTFVYLGFREEFSIPSEALTILNVDYQMVRMFGSGTFGNVTGAFFGGQNVGFFGALGRLNLVAISICALGIFLVRSMRFTVSIGQTNPRVIAIGGVIMGAIAGIRYVILLVL